MTLSKWLAYGSIAIAALGLAVGCTLAGKELLAPVVTILGIVWMVAVMRQWFVVSEIAMVIFISGAVYGTWQGFLPGLMLVVLVASLSAWDLVSMLARFKKVKRESIGEGIERRHLIRLAAVDGLGLVSGAAGLLIRTRLNFVMIVLLGLIVAIGLSQLLFRLQQSRE